MVSICLLRKKVLRLSLASWGRHWKTWRSLVAARVAGTRRCRYGTLVYFPGSGLFGTRGIVFTVENRNACETKEAFLQANGCSIPGCAAKCKGPYSLAMENTVGTIGLG